MRQAPRLAAARAAALGIAFVRLVGACLADEDLSETGPSFRPNEPTPVRIQSYIAQHAADPGLDAERLVATFRLPRSALYRICAGDGGVTALIPQRRTAIVRAACRGRAAAHGRRDRADERLHRGRALNWVLHDLHATTASRPRRAARDTDLAAERSRVEVEALLDR